MVGATFAAPNTYDFRGTSTSAQSALASAFTSSFSGHSSCTEAGAGPRTQNVS